ncbi:hypothetical protein FRC17_000828 [Serendipita sp. 399]|nr:hypothetical protein FRC17_000828 [Serendipita sp. 399]
MLSPRHRPIGDSYDEWIPLTPKSEEKHSSYPIRNESGFKVRFLIGGPIIGYILMAITTAVVLIVAIDGHRFRITYTDNIFELDDGRIIFLPFAGLRQSDITTLISLSSTLTRFLGSICCGIACWRAAYILLEREGLTLADLEGLVTLPFLRPWPWGTYRLMISFIVLLFLSSELYSPILNGSVAWKAAMSPAATKQVLRGLTEASGQLVNLPQTREGRIGLVSRSVAQIAAASSGRSDSPSSQRLPVEGGAYPSELWRIEKAVRELPVNSTLANITLPFFVIDSLEWIPDPEQTLDPTMLNVVNWDSGLINYSIPISPMDASAPGYVALFPNTSPATTVDIQTQDLTPTTAIGSYYVVLKLGGPSSGGTCQGGHTGQFFDSVPPEVKPYPPLGIYMCVAFARVSLRAGAGRCVQCRVASPLVLRSQSAMELQPDYVTEVVLHVMSDVIRDLYRLNITLISPSKVGLEAYIVDTLSQAYSGVWNVLTQQLRLFGDELETSVQTDVQVSEAKVDTARVVGWMTLNITVALCCAAIVFVQASTGRRRVLVDATLAAVLLDATEVVDHLEGRKDGEDEEGEGGGGGRDISNMSLLLDEEKSTRVRLKGGGDGENGESHVHFRLVPDTP